MPCVGGVATLRASEAGIAIRPRGLLTALPCVASYVGGDVVADVLVSGMTRSTDLSLLIDLGTNGELVLGNRSGWCAVRPPPALPLRGAASGAACTLLDGAIERVNLGRGGRVADCAVVEGGKPLGLCGSGLIDLVGELLRVGCIDRRGRYRAPTCADRLRIDEAGEPEFVLFPGEETALGRDIVLTESDIQNLIRSKGSIFMGAECLVDYVGSTFADVRTSTSPADSAFTSVSAGRSTSACCRTCRWSVSISSATDPSRARRWRCCPGRRCGTPRSDVRRHDDLPRTEHAPQVYERVQLLPILPHTDIEKFPSAMKGKR